MILILLLSTLISFTFAQDICIDEVCINEVLEELEVKYAFDEENCKDQDTIDEICWINLQQIHQLESKLSQIKLALTINQGESCQADHTSNSESFAPICTDEIKAQRNQKCKSDLLCSFRSNFDFYRVAPTTKDCNTEQDSCVTQFATGFIKSVSTFLKGTGTLFSASWNKLKSFWQETENLEEHSSNTALAMAQASKDDTLFERLTSDFWGTMYEMYSSLIEALKLWLKNDIFCQKWEGLPRYSQCQEPAATFECIGCKTFINGLCGSSGVIISEVIPAFITGGLFSVVKHGSFGVAHIVKTVRISDKAYSKIKMNKALQRVNKQSLIITQKLSRSQSLRKVNIFIQRNLHRPSKVKIANIKEKLATGKAWVIQGETGKYLAFSQKALTKLGDVLIFPIENALTVKAFKKGIQTIDEIFVLSKKSINAPKIKLSRTIAIEEVVKNASLSDEARIKKAFELLGDKKISFDQKEKLQQGLLEAHRHAADKTVYGYNWRELRQKYTILINAGYTQDEAQLLLRRGLAGKPPTRQQLSSLDRIFTDHAESLLKKDFNQREKNLSLMISNEFSFQKAKVIQENLESLDFVDYKDSFKLLNLISDNRRKIDEVDLASIYSRQSFANFLEARNVLKKNNPSLTVDEFKNIHHIMMKNKVDGFSPEKLGKIRVKHAYGLVSEKEAISLEAFQNLEENIYTSTKLLQKNSDGKFFGKIIYPHINNTTEAAISRASKIDFMLGFQVKEYRALSLIHKNLDQFKSFDDIPLPDVLKNKYTSIQGLKDGYARYSDTKFLQDLNQSYITALINERLSWFKKARSELGELDSAQKVNEYVDNVAQLHRDLISIHPFSDGNGRTIRELALNHMLRKEGLPTVRLKDPNSDIYLSLKDWQEQVKQGVIAKDALTEDLTQRIRFKLPLENSYQLTSVNANQIIPLTLKKKKSSTTAYANEFVPAEEARVYRQNKVNKKLYSEKQNYDDIQSSIRSEYQKNNIYYQHPKKGIERVQLTLVDEDFKILFGKATYDNKELYDFKMQQGYHDQVAWRGIASQEKIKSEEDIIRMFKEVHEDLSSNAVINKTKSSNSLSLVDAAKLEFENYNSNVLDQGIEKLAKEHSESGDLYFNGYGYSTSQSKTVGKAFAMGAMVVGKYGEHVQSSLQATLKSRTLIGVQRARKDIDLARLKQLRSDFSYKYGRQQEVIGVGASDPDATKIVQTLDDEGSVLRSYLRNPADPSKVWVIKGDIRVDEIPTQSQIIKVIDLKN